MAFQLPADSEFVLLDEPSHPVRHFPTAKIRCMTCGVTKRVLQKQLPGLRQCVKCRPHRCEGKTFGKLRVLRWFYQESRLYLECSCADCLFETTVAYQALLTGHTLCPRCSQAPNWVSGTKKKPGKRKKL